MAAKEKEPAAAASAAADNRAGKRGNRGNEEGVMRIDVFLPNGNLDCSQRATPKTLDLRSPSGQDPSFAWLQFRMR